MSGVPPYLFRSVARVEGLNEALLKVPTINLERMPREVFDDAAELVEIWKELGMGMYGPADRDYILGLAANITLGLQTAGLFSKFEFGKTLSFYFNNHHLMK